MTSESLYLDLMKKTLSCILWPEPPIPLEAFTYTHSPIRAKAVSIVSKILDKRGMELVRRQDFTLEQRMEGKVWPRYADTMIGMKRLDNIQDCVACVLEDKVDGDLIETGVWRGGAAIFMRAILAAAGVVDRKVWVADSFEGLPKPDDKYPADKGDIHHTYNAYLGVSQEEVEQNFRKYGLLDDQVVFLKGWFKDTLPQAPIENLAILRLDGDMYGSTMEALEALYPKLSYGGFCIVDDYALKGCRAAVNDFISKYSLSVTINEIDWSGVFWRKED